MTQPESEPIAEESAAPIVTTPPRAPTNDGAEAVRRRDIAALLGGALGMFALTKCGGEPQNAGGAQPGEGERTNRVAQGLSNLAVTAADTIADLKAINVTGLSQGTLVIVLGYYQDNDGGGGPFFWTTDTATPDDAATVIVPTATPRTGCWKRLISEPLSVRWFGAKGDGVTDDTAAIQRAIDFVAMNFINPSSPYVLTDCTGSYQYSLGNDVVVPPGTYVLTAPSGGAALWIAKNNVTLRGTGGAPYGPTFILKGSGSAIVIEAGGSPSGQLPDGGSCANEYPNSGPIARGAEIRNLNINSIGATNRDGIVVHAPNVAIYDTNVTQMVRYGILIESGSSSGVLGATQAPSGSQFLVDFWRLTNVDIAACGNVASKGDPAQGAAVYVRGSDANGGLASAVHAIGCNVGFYDASLGDTWIGCYSEGGQLGIMDVSAAGSTWIRCESEDMVSASFQSGLAIDGAIAQYGHGAAPQRIGPGSSQLQFGTVGGDGALYGANVPGAGPINSSISLSRDYPKWHANLARRIGDLVIPDPPNGSYYQCTVAGNSGTTQPAFTSSTVTDGSVTWTLTGSTNGTSTWSFGYQPTGNTGVPPHMLQSWWWAHYTAGLFNPDIDSAGGTFGWTDAGHPRGGGLPMILNPLMNTRRRWTCKQSADSVGAPISLQPGANLVYLSSLQGGTTPTQWVQYANAGNYPSGGAANAIWSKAQPRVSVDIEFASDSQLASAPEIRVAGYSYVPMYDNSNPPVFQGNNIAVKLINTGSSTITSTGAGFTLVWHFESFVTNYDSNAIP